MTNDLAAQQGIADDLDVVVMDICQLMLQCGCEPAAASGEVPAGCIHVAVDFTNPCAGACFVSLDAASADALAECMLTYPCDDVALRDDALRELCNMVGGGWKSRQHSAGAQMSPPRLAESRAVPFPVALERTYTAAAFQFTVQLCLATTV